jgi:hypothetical protein
MAVSLLPLCFDLAAHGDLYSTQGISLVFPALHPELDVQPHRKMDIHPGCLDAPDWVSTASKLFG